MKWITPTGTVNGLYQDVLSNSHILIGGATGAGKSVFMRGLIHDILYRAPVDIDGGAYMILCDPKKVELIDFDGLPHTLRAAYDKSGIVAALQVAEAIMYQRYDAMQKRHIKLYTGADVYVIVDEYADLMLSAQKKRFQALVQSIAELGRAARVHIILATQAPSRAVVTANIALNMTCKVALRCDSAIESRQLIGCKGAEELPENGTCLMKTPNRRAPEWVTVRMYTPEEETQVIEHWKKQVDNRSKRWENGRKFWRK